MVVVLLYIVRLFMLQVVDQSTQAKAEKNAQLRQTIYPSRGLIYDRNGELLVANQPIYEVTMIVREMMQEPFDTLGLCNALNISRDSFEMRMPEINTKTLQEFLGQQANVVLISQGTFAIPNGWQSRFDIGQCSKEERLETDLIVGATGS